MRRSINARKPRTESGTKEVDPGPIETLPLSEWLDFLRTGGRIERELVQELNLPAPGRQANVQGTLALIGGRIHRVDLERLEAEIREKDAGNESLVKTLCLAGGLIPLNAAEQRAFEASKMRTPPLDSLNDSIPEDAELQPNHPDGHVPPGAWELYLRPPIQPDEEALQEELRQMCRMVDTDDLE